MPLRVINYEDHYVEALRENGNTLIVVAFYTAWMERCKWVASFLEDFQKRRPDVLCLVIDIDAGDEAGDIADKEDVNDAQVPTFKFYRNNKEVTRPILLATRENVLSTLTTILAN